LSLFIVIGLWSGRRKEAILSLKWSQVDFETGLVDFRAPGTETSTKRRGIVRVPSRRLGHLRRARKHSKGEYVVSWNGDRMGDIKRSFTTAVEAAGLGDDVTPHTLRHTTATWLMQKGATPFSAAHYLSMSVETLLKVYAKFSPDHQADVLKALS
jgi:integrase